MVISGHHDRSQLLQNLHCQMSLLNHSPNFSALCPPLNCRVTFTTNFECFFMKIWRTSSTSNEIVELTRVQANPSAKSSSLLYVGELLLSFLYFLKFCSFFSRRGEASQIYILVIVKRPPSQLNAPTAWTNTLTRLYVRGEKGGAKGVRLTTSIYFWRVIYSDHYLNHVDFVIFCRFCKNDFLLHHGLPSHICLIFLQELFSQLYTKVLWLWPS